MSLTRVLILIFIVINIHGYGQQVYNHLRYESSPYLRQHAKNPVDWYPWNAVTLKKATTENKLLVISIGYSSCHWCHVMEKESFSDTAVSALMNKHFVSIKVDREERPDVDKVYMDACQVVNGDACGWPLNAIALPNGQTVFTGTYMEKNQWIQVLRFFADQINAEPAKLIEYSKQLADRIAKENSLTKNVQALSDSLFQDYFQGFFNNLDLVYGGQKGSPKFPLPVQYEFLLNYHQNFKQPKALEAVTNALDNLIRGGIHDWLEGGFARYSTDDRWLMPHFEKMLYDNAQLTSLYAHAFQVTRKEEYKKITRSGLDFINRKLKAPSGGYYSSFDADSEGEEGKYYLWTKSEIEEVLKENDLIELAVELFQLSEEGNTTASRHFGQEGKNVLAMLGTEEAIKNKKGWTPQVLNLKLQEIKKRLTAARNLRPRPALDDKIICSWNSLTVSALADGYLALGDKAYQLQALRTGEFIWRSFYTPKEGLRRIYNPNVKSAKTVEAFLDDYAYTGLAFIKLYQLSFDEKWLNRARSLVEFAQKHFYDSSHRMFYYNRDTAIGRQLDYEDQVMPSSNSSMAFLLFQLGSYFSNQAYLDQATDMMNQAFSQMQDEGVLTHYVNWARLFLQTRYHPPYEIAVLGNTSLAISHSLASKYIPNAIFLGGRTEGSLPLLKDKLVAGKTMIYICQNKLCKLPVTTLSEAWALIGVE